MSIKICAYCGQSFQPDPRVKNHSYCSATGCQKERRKQWRQTKMKTDLDYRDNKSRIQRDWLDRNPNYWREYRKKDVNKPQPTFSESPSPTGQGPVCTTSDSSQTRTLLRATRGLLKSHLLV